MQAAMMQWLKSRMLPGKIVALWGVVLSSCFLSAPTMFASASAFLLLCVLTLLLIAAFRLWDDLADRDFDRQRSDANRRVLVQLDSSALRPFYFTAAALLVVSSVLLYQWHGLFAAACLWLLIGFMAAAYYFLPASTQHCPLRTALVLLKYPAMLIVLTGGQLSLTTGMIAVALYGLLLAYEWYESRKNIHNNTS